MEIALFVAGIALLLYVLLAFYDGFILHIFKYRLYQREESRKEHLTHTLRAILFPFIAYYLFAKPACNTAFFVAIAAVTLDLFVMLWDAYLEKDSRAFMGGLPRWEYILHLLVNGFHFVSVAAGLILRLDLTSEGIVLVDALTALPQYDLFRAFVLNLLPGAVLLAILHVLVLFPTSAALWDRYRDRVRCC
jgi:hypothetical protein